MPKKKRYARIAITLPEQDLAAADRFALAYDRSRSWIVAEAIRRYAAATDAAPHPGRVASRELDEPSGAWLRNPGLGASRLAQLTRDLSLTPEARVQEAEATLGLTEQQEKQARPRAHQVLAFDRYEDFLDWKRSRGRS